MIISYRKMKIYIILILILLTAFTAYAAAVTVSIDAPDEVYVSDIRFNIEIEIDHVDGLDSAQFDIVFNPSVINMSEITSGEIDGTKIPLDDYEFMDKDRLRVLVNVPIEGGEMNGVSGKGTLVSIDFEVLGKDGDNSPLDFYTEGGPNSYPVLSDTEGGSIKAEWVGTMVNISEQPTGTSDSYLVTIYVKNIDDDKLDVHLLIDGIDKGSKKILSGSTGDFKNYKLEKGVHTSTIYWYDLDTNNWHEKTHKYNITNATTLLLTTDDHDEDEDKISAHVYVESLDKDSLDVYLYIDGNYKKYSTVSSNKSVDFGEYEFEEDEESLHSFKLKWYDPSAEEEYEKTTRSYITSEEALTLIVDSHMEGGSMSISDAGSTSVSTTPAVTATQSTKSSTSDKSKSTAGGEGTSDSASTQAPIESEQLDNSSRTNDLIHSFNNIFILVGFVAVLIALYQIRKV